MGRVGKPGGGVTRARIALLNQVGERDVFEKYLEVRTVQKLAEYYFVPHGDAERPGAPAFYKWLRAAEGRWERWQEIKKIQAQNLSDEALQTALDATVETVHLARLKNSALNTRAVQLDPDLSPNRQKTEVNVQSNVAVSIGSEWLAAILEAESVSPENPVKPENRVSPENPRSVDFEIVDDDTESP